MSRVIEVCPSVSSRLEAYAPVGWEDLEIGVFNVTQSRTAARTTTERLSTVSSTKKSLPAYVLVDTFPVIIEDETIKLEVE